MWVMLEQDLLLSIRVGQGTDRTRDMQSPGQRCQPGSSSSTGWEPRIVLCVAAVVGLGQGHGGKAGDWVQVQGDVQKRVHNGGHAAAGAAGHIALQQAPEDLLHDAGVLCAASPQA